MNFLGRAVNMNVTDDLYAGNRYCAIEICAPYESVYVKTVLMYSW